MAWFSYNQNNSGGYFDEPAMRVVVEAASEVEAEKVARENGVDPGAPYCECCGERWSVGYPRKYEARPSESDLGVAGRFYVEWADQDGVPRALFVAADGSKETLR